MREASSQDTGWTLVVAIAQNGVIGHNDDLPWRLSSDLKRFKRMTMGHCLLMGRKTYESIGRPLPGRQTIVLSRSDFEPGDAQVKVCSELGQIDACVESGRNVMVVGGSQIYQATMDWCDTVWLTRVLADVDGDTFFPDVDWSDWLLESEEELPAGEKDEYPTAFQIWNRVRSRA